ncbi:hypothetical protein [Abyssibius alkaniclasticus]|uniref:hypothetical protein n=1 Tax=Abyssibius alkaniclasticus TaxID=2881234 RepID=UPI004057E494
MKKLLALCAILISGATGVYAQSGLTDQVVGALRANECTMRMGVLVSQFTANGAAEGDIRRSAGELVNNGQLGYDFATDMLTLDAAVCVVAEEEATNPLLAKPEIATFVSVLSANGCAIAEADVDEMFANTDLPSDDAFVAGSRLVMAGLAAFDPGSQMLVLDGSICDPNAPAVASAPITETPIAAPAPAPVAEAAPAATEAPAPAVFSARDLLVAFIELNGCAIHMHEFVRLLPEQGLSMNEASVLVAELSAEGKIQFLPNASALILKGTSGCS